MYSKKIKEICQKIDSGKTAEALEKSNRLKVPLNSKNTKFFICNTFLKSYLKKSANFTELDARNMFDTTLISSALYKALPEGRKKAGN